MAKLVTNAEIAFDMEAIDLNFFLREKYDGGLAKNVNHVFVEPGPVYPDIFWLIGDDGARIEELDIGGVGLAATAGVISAGTVTGIFDSDATFLGDGMLWRLEGISLTGAAVGAAIKSASRSDDFALIASALAGDDRIVLSAGNDRAYGFAGNDTIVGRGGADFLAGGLGDDWIYGGTGMDIASYGGAHAVAGVVVDLRAGTATGGAGTDHLEGIEGVVGSSWADKLAGNNLASLLDGGAGDDVLSGRGGDDLLAGGAGRDVLRGGDDDDFLIGGSGNDTLYGNTGADRLIGGAGSDWMSAGADGDVDSFIYSAVSDSSPGTLRDRLSGFASGSDRIDLRDIDANTAADGNQAFTLSASGPTAHAVWLVDIGDHLLVRADVDGDLAADFEIQVQDCDVLTATDFLL